MVALSILLFGLVLAAPFGEAEAAAIEAREGLVIEVSVVVDGSWEAVLVRPFSAFEELPPTALVEQEGDRWGGTVRLPTAEDWSIVFDAIDPDGASVRSDTATLIGLGVDPVVLDGPVVGPVPDEPIPATTWWLVAGIALALLALGVLAWWTFAADAPSDDPGSALPSGSEGTD